GGGNSSPSSGARQPSSVDARQPVDALGTLRRVLEDAARSVVAQAALDPRQPLRPPSFEPHQGDPVPAGVGDPLELGGYDRPRTGVGGRDTVEAELGAQPLEAGLADLRDAPSPMEPDDP